MWKRTANFNTLSRQATDVTVTTNKYLRQIKWLDVHTN